MHRGRQALHARVEQLAGFFGVVVGEQLHRAFSNGEEDDGLFAFAFEGGFGGQDFFRKIGGGVAAGGLRLSSHRGQACGPSRASDGCAAAPTKLEPGRIGKSARGARGRHRRAALTPKLQPFGVVKATARAVHGGTLRHDHTSGQGIYGQGLRRRP